MDKNKNQCVSVEKEKEGHLNISAGRTMMNDECRSGKRFLRRTNKKEIKECLSRTAKQLPLFPLTEDT